MRLLSHSLLLLPLLPLAICTSSIVCYDYSGETGDQYRTSSAVPQLWMNDFDNTIESCCFSGVWVLYVDDTYNYASSAGAWWGYGEGYCSNTPPVFRNQASSLRPSGNPGDWTADSLTLYSQEFFGGEARVVVRDTEQLNGIQFDNLAESVVLTGCTAWTLYQYDDFLGDSLCLLPGDRANSTRVNMEAATINKAATVIEPASDHCVPGFYGTKVLLGRLAGKVSSMRKGCWTGTLKVPSSQGMNQHQHNGGGWGGSGWSGQV